MNVKNFVIIVVFRALIGPLSASADVLIFEKSLYSKSEIIEWIKENEHIEVQQKHLRETETSYSAITKKQENKTYSLISVGPGIKILKEKN